MLHLTAPLQQICNHAQRAYPEECCGLLLGSAEEGIVEVWETANAWNAEAAEAIAALIPAETAAHGKRDRYWIDPRDLLKAQQFARDRQLTILGIYHSHPDHPAVPSECDRVIAWSRYVYVIVSVQAGEAIDCRAWRLDEQQQFQPEDLASLEPPGRSEI